MATINGGANRIIAGPVCEVRLEESINMNRKGFLFGFGAAWLTAFALVFFSYYWFQRSNIIAFQLHYLADPKFEKLLQSKPTWLEGFTVKRYSSEIPIWVISLSPLVVRDRYLKTDNAIFHLREWSKEAMLPEIYGDSVLFHEGARNEPALFRE